MTARPMWKAEISLDSVRVPVKLYAAVQDTTTHFRLLNKADLTPVKQHMVDTTSKSEVPADDMQRAVQVEPGVFVLMTEDELAQLEPEPSRSIVVKQVVKRAHVDVRWFERPYFLGPDGEPGRYFALAQALERGAELAIAQWVMRGERYAGAVHAEDGYLMISAFRHADELARIDRIRPNPDRAPDARELALADQLIAALEDTFDPSAYRDEFHDRVQDLLRKRAAGNIVEFPKAQPAAATESTLLDSLRASVKHVKREANAATKR